MFTHSILTKHSLRAVISSSRFLSTGRHFSNVRLSPKVKRVLAVTAAAGTTASLAYYLLQDQERYVDMFGVHEQVHPLALNPERGGAKNLPITHYQIDDSAEDITKPRLVVLGSGWGAVSLLKNLEKDKYHITVISENNYFLFTPLLPSATVGTLELRYSINTFLFVTY